ncbi:probable oxidoreductase Env9p [[Candida] railenensis]|uniref:Probable oxidoreductase Env9p n=1 Tax=[Candida] railenensis TaxID=45579 RepID=A0A9P0QQF9_9ASCO|nr:probable oxidoreductase Env9p [[Candida] railenensis]
MFDPTELQYLNPNIDRRIAIVTGGNSGIGFYTALHLYLHGYIVYIAGRNKTRVTKAIVEMKEVANVKTLQYSPDQVTERYNGELFFLEIDLLDLNSVIRAAEIFKSLESSLHILVNNAGVMALPFSLTKDGFEIQLQTNYISPFLFTTRLLPLLEKTAATPNKIAGSTEPIQPRIVYVSSIGHHFAFRYFNMNSHFQYYPNIMFTWFRYGIAKTAAIHFMKMLALRNPKILCLSVHPGFVMNTNLFAYWTRLPIIGILFWCLFQIFGYIFGVSNEEGAMASLKCCLDPSLNVEQDNGKYFATGGVEASPSRVARNMDYAARTWIWTLKELGNREISI